MKPPRTLLAPALVASAVLASAALAPRDLAASPALRVEGRRFIDDGGGVVVLRGVNVAGNSKVPPFKPVAGPAFFDPVAGWGMNVVRLLFTWEAYEPSPGVYDLTYLDYYAQAVASAASRGLYVIVDFHQDAFSRWSVGGCGEGIPGWAVPPWVPRATPRNDASCSAWGATMIIDAGMHASWNAFYSDATGARARYLAMAESVARRLAGQRAVIGYDMLNEPWGDEPTEIHALHEDAAVAIRRADPTAILFVSPHALTSAGTRSNLSRPSFANFAFSPHFYDGGVVVAHSWSGGSLDGPFGNMRGVAEGWGVPLFVGEFGAHAGTTNGRGYVDALYDGLDATLASGAQWVYTPGWTPAAKDGWNGEDLSIVDETGATRPNFAPRPYPKRISGMPTRFIMTGAGPADRAIELAWDNSPQAGATDVYVPVGALFGGAGIAVDVTGVQLACTTSANAVQCTSPAAGPMQIRVHAAAPPPPQPPPGTGGCARAGGEAAAIPAFALFVARRRARARRSHASRG